MPRMQPDVLAEFLRLVRGEGSAALIATHNERLAARMDRVVRLHEGLRGGPAPGARRPRQSEKGPVEGH